MRKKTRSLQRTRVIRALRVGESATFTRTLKPEELASPFGLGLSASSKLAQTIGTYASRRCPGSSFSYETFTTFTSQQRPIAGVIITRLTGEATDIDAPIRVQRCRICKCAGHYAKTCPEAK